MSNLPETSSFDSVYELQRTDVVDAGVAGAGVANSQAQALTNRTKYLYDQLGGIGAGTTNGLTQPIFDQTTLLATTEFVQLNKGDYPLVFRVNATINPLTIGSGWLGVAGALFVTDNLSNGSQVITLQSLAAIPAGAAIHFKNEDPTYPITIDAASGELFVSPSNLDSGNTGQNSIILAPGTDITIVRSATDSILGSSTPHWHIIVHSGNLRQWQTPSLQPHIINNSGGAPGRYIKKGNTLVLSGALLKSGGSSVYGLTIFTLPAGFRPITETRYFLSAPATATNPPVVISIATNGDVYAEVIGHTAFISDIGLEGIIMPLD